MALQLLEINSRLTEINKRATRMTYALRYGQRYYANKDYFEQYITLTQGNLSVMEYADEFERLHYLCELGDTLDFNHFLKGLRPSILKKVEKACNDMYEAFWEAIRVERMLKRSHLRKVAPQEEKSPHVTDRVEEPVPTDLQPELPELDTDDSISTVGLEVFSMSTDHPDVHTPCDEAQVVDIPHISPQIDFVFMDQQWQSGDQERLVRYCDLMVQILQVNHPTVRLHINTNFTHQKQLCMKLYMEAANGPTNRTFVRLIFDPGGHFPNSRSSSFSSGGE